MKEFKLGRAAIQGIDPDTDHIEVTLSNKDIEQALFFGAARDAENRGTADKDGYDKTNDKLAHTNVQNDSLAVAAEIAVAKGLGFDPYDTSVLTLFRRKPYPPDSPDILGVYEVRRLNDPASGIRFYNKDVAHNALIVAVVVDHVCDKNNFRILPTARLLGWNYPVLDQAHLERKHADGGRIKRFRMRPMHELPLVGGAVVGEAA